jgi:hypothetical protein
MNQAKALLWLALASALLLALPNQARAQTELLVNTNFADQKTGWTTTGNANAIAAGSTYYNCNGADTCECPPDAEAQTVNILDGGSYVGNSYGTFSAAISYTTWSQVFAATPGSTFNAGGWAYGSHEDLSGPNAFWFEVDFLDASQTLLATYESYNVANLTCTETNPFPVDTWNFLAVTNEIQVTGGAATGTVIGNIGTNGVITAPAGTATVRYQIVFENINYAGGSMYFDNAYLNQLSGAAPPAITSTGLNNIILCTNTTLSCVASSASGTITNVALILSTSTLGGKASKPVTNNLASPVLTGLGTDSVTVNYPLTNNLIYSVTVVATDNNGNVASTVASFDTLAPSLVIEAEDFNYSSGMFTNTPSDGGLALYAYAPLGVAEIDLQKNPGNGTQAADGSYYRSDDVIICGTAAPDNGTAQKYVTAAANGDTTDVPIEVGYNGVGDWLDYTRTFGAGGSAPSGTYAIWARLATVGSGTALNYYQVTAGQGTTNQTLSQLGSFSFTDNDWNGFVYSPLLDQFGNLVSMTLSGDETFRSVVVGNPNIDFYMMVPAVPILTPKLQFAYPDGLHIFEPTNNFTFTVGPANGSNIVSSGIDVVLNGVDITSSPNLTLTASGSSWTGNYPIASNAVYAAVINVTNTAGLSSSFTINFDTFDVNNYQWEPCDYDFSTNGITGGLFIDNPVPSCDITTPQTGEFATNSYFGYPGDLVPAALALQGVDIGWGDSQPEANNYYRNDGVGTEPSGDYVRPQFIAAQKFFNDPNIGPFQIGYFDGGNWLNYTRHYPTNTYNVWARLAGGAGPFSGTLLSMVVSNYGTANQVSNVLGSFSDPNAAGWEAYHWIPLLDSTGKKAVVSLGGLATLTLTSGNNLNAGFFMLVPAPPTSQITPTLVGGNLNLSFPTAVGHNYTVVFKSALTSPSWTQVGSVIPGTGGLTNVNVTLSGSQGFYTVGEQ